MTNEERIEWLERLLLLASIDWEHHDEVSPERAKELRTEVARLCVKYKGDRS